MYVCVYVCVYIYIYIYIKMSFESTTLDQLSINWVTVKDFISTDWTSIEDLSNSESWLIEPRSILIEIWIERTSWATWHTLILSTWTTFYWVIKFYIVTNIANLKPNSRVSKKKKTNSRVLPISCIMGSRDLNSHTYIIMERPLNNPTPPYSSLSTPSFL